MNSLAQEDKVKLSINARSTWHPAITNDHITDAVERRMRSLDNPGFCIACGEEADGCEPDAQHYLCEHCGERQVYGADELLLRIAP
jgi:hypothetical protein